jgi:phosphoglycerate dehydrogenase-like enzyme
MPLTDEKLLIHIHAPPNPGYLDKLRARFPGLTVCWEEAKVVNGLPESADNASAEAWDGVTMLFTYPACAYDDKFERVRWVQLASAGSDHWKTHGAFRDPGVLFCSASGAQT